MTVQHLTVLRVADVESAARVWQAAWTDGHRGHVPGTLIAVRDSTHFTTYLRRRIADTTVCVGREGNICGLVISDLSGGEVVQLAVAADARGTGAADELLEAAEARLRARHRRAWLAVVPGNGRARAFYARHGWHDDGAYLYHAPAGRVDVAVPVRRYVKDLHDGTTRGEANR